MDLTAGPRVMKYLVPKEELFTLQLPKDASILTLIEEDGEFYFYVLADVSEDAVPRSFLALGTLQVIPEEFGDLEYVATARTDVNNGDITAHIFEVHRVLH